jgi:protein phosphatase
MPNLERSTAEHHYLTIGRCTVVGAFRSDAGPTRQSNEDSAALVIPSDDDILESQGVLGVVADGMGGHEGGEVASRIAVESIPELYYQDLASEPQPPDPKRALVAALHSANERIFKQAAEVHQLVGMGSTCTALVLRGGLAWCAHVGDSRAYLVRDGGIYRMTQDHSATMAMVSQGLLTLAEARHHEDRNVILRAMGTHPVVEVSTWKDPFPVRPGDCFLLCSDGLHDALSDDEIGELCQSAQSPDAICEALIQEAIDREASDNVTVLVLCVRAVDDAAFNTGTPEGEAA